MLTTIRQPKYQLGVAAVDTLIQLMKGQRPEVKRLAAGFVECKSTAPPKAA